MIKDVISVDDEDIDWVEHLLGNISFDQCRREVIKSLDSIDIQACPGSGKTTVLVAKLAILAKKWPYSNRGICILSHTNVAREEIQDRLGKTEVGRKLLSYPHFIGTLQSFADRFISMPWIRSLGMPVNVIDNDYVLNKRWSKLKRGTKIYLERNRSSLFCCEAQNIPLELGISCGKDTNTYMDIESVIKASHKAGEFTFKEMFLIADHAINKNRSLPQSIQNRFPILLLDEAQDTNPMQWNLLQKAFPEESTLSIRQSYGDSNQAIYNSLFNEEQNDFFPRKGALTMGNSKRFNSKIASLADVLSVSFQGMTGEITGFEKNDEKHTLFVYKKGEIGSVIPAFAKHVQQCFTDEELLENSRYGCHVLGMVHRETEGDADGEKFPQSLCNYWDCYNPNTTGRSASPKHLVDYFVIGKWMFGETNNLGVLVDWVAKGLKRYINMNSSYKISSSVSTFRAILNEFPLEKHHAIRTEMLSIITSDFNSKDEWDSLVRRVRGIIDEKFEITEVHDDILAWKEYCACGKEQKQKDEALKANQYTYKGEEGRRPIGLQLGSIHSVKGRTHLATLVVETCWYDPNIKSIIPWLCGNPPKKIQSRNATRLKCHYVALSRAKALVCIALPLSSIDDKTEQKLKERGWCVVYL